MLATKIKIGGSFFLLPDSHGDYEFPTYIVEHKEAILEHVMAGNKLKEDPLADHFDDLPDMTEFRRITGIIGFPFDAHDPDLFALDRGVEIVLEVEI